MKHKTAELPAARAIQVNKNNLILKVMRTYSATYKFEENEISYYENANGDKMVAIITDFEENTYTNGFRISFRLYNITEGIGGFETTLCVANAPKSAAKMFCGSKSDYQNAAKLIGAKINSIKTDNKVGIKFQFSSISSQF